MVVFTCNHCGDSLQKPKVEKHYSYACRTVKSLTCVDCFKDFRGEEYVVHTKCITEDERYAAKGTYANGIVKKGEVKQETWVEMVKSILDNDHNLKPSCRNLLNTVSHYSNIPRKKHKFINFIKSSSGGRANMKDVEEVWNLIEKYKNNKIETNGSTTGNTVKLEESESNGISEEKESKNKNNAEKKRTAEETEEAPKKKKHKTEKQQLEVVATKDENDVPKKKKKLKTDKEVIVETKDENVVEENTKFNFEEKILEILSAKGIVSLKKLQKKVLNAYLKGTGKAEATPKAIKKFNKKLKKVPNLEVNEDKVTILQTD